MKRVFLFLLTNLAIMLVLGVVISVFGLGQVLDEQGIDLDLQALLVLSAVVGMTGSVISLAMSKFMAKRMTNAQVIEVAHTEQEEWLFKTVQRQAQAAGIGMPEVAIYDAPDMNAFATGMFRNSALVAVSTGLLAAMKRDEVEAVLAHEVSHIANGDMITLALIQGVVNTFVFFLSRVVGHVVDPFASVELYQRPNTMFVVIFGNINDPPPLVQCCREDRQVPSEQALPHVGNPMHHHNQPSLIPEILVKISRPCGEAHREGAVSD